jgi:hypothetical protein
MTNSMDADNHEDDIFNMDYDTFDDQLETEREPNATELSIMLLFLWRKHSMTKAAINDICKILNGFRIPNMPRDFRGVMSHVKKNNPTLFHPNQCYICPSCFNKSSNSSKCEVVGCESSRSYIRSPTFAFTFPLTPQIISILERETLESSIYKPNECYDVFNSQYHQDIVMREKQTHPERNIITFTLNTDGVLVKQISRSLWITCVCVNELPRCKRFEIQNILICSISTGSEKPKKDEFSLVLQDIVNELKVLENQGFDVILPSTDETKRNKYTHFHAFTIAATCDKPAQSLMMNLKDPTGYFSCGWCCLPGTNNFVVLNSF